MIVSIKKIDPKATTPRYAKEGDAGMDLVATSKSKEVDGYIKYGTGLAFEIPKGYVGLLFPRSSISKVDLSLANAVGVLDSGYRGEVSFHFKRAMPSSVTSHLDHVEYSVGDRIAQIVIIPFPEVIFEEVPELGISERGEGGFGSTGN